MAYVKKDHATYGNFTSRESCLLLHLYQKTLKIILDLIDCCYTISLAPQVHYIIYDKLWQGWILRTKLTHTTVLCQNCLLLWLNLLILPTKVLNPYFKTVACFAWKSRIQSRRYFGREPAVVNIPYTKQQIDCLFHNSDSWTIVFVQFEGQIKNLLAADPLLQFTQLHSFIFPKVLV